MERILKMEHIAEALTAEFFETFLKYPKSEVPAFIHGSDSRKVKSSDFAKFVGAKPQIHPQLKINKYFNVDPRWKSYLAKSASKIVIDSITCFDCAIENAAGKLLPIEVKSGNSARYGSARLTISYSRNKKKVKASTWDGTTYLKGDLISILSTSLNSAHDLSFNFKNKTVKRPLVKKTSSKFKLTEDWILVVRSNSQFENYKPPKNSRIAYIFSIEGMVEFLKEKNKLPKKRTTGKLTHFEKRILEDMSFAISDENLKKK